jgi:hypothetical protein
MFNLVVTGCSIRLYPGYRTNHKGKPGVYREKNTDFTMTPGTPLISPSTRKEHKTSLIDGQSVGLASGRSAISNKWIACSRLREAAFYSRGTSNWRLCEWRSKSFVYSFLITRPERSVERGGHTGTRVGGVRSSAGSAPLYSQQFWKAQVCAEYAAAWWFLLKGFRTFCAALNSDTEDFTTDIFHSPTDEKIFLPFQC